MGGGAQYFELQRVAKLLGVTVNALDRRIRRGDLPEAVKVDDVNDTEWVVHRDALAPIAEREGWIIDLRKIEEAISSHPSGAGGNSDHDTDLESMAEPASADVEGITQADMTDIETNGAVLATDSITHDTDTDTGDTDTSIATDNTATDNTATDSSTSAADTASNGDNADVHVVSHGDGEATSIFSGLDDSLNELLERLLTMSSDLTTAVVEKERALQKVETHEQTIKVHESKIVELTNVIEGQETEMSRVVTDLNEAKTGLKVAEALAEERAIQIDELHEDLDQQRNRHILEIDRHRAQTADLRRRLESTSRELGWWSRRRIRKQG